MKNPRKYGLPMTTITVVETQQFIDSSSHLLSTNEIEGIRYLVANKPTIGEVYDPILPELLALQWRNSELLVFYTVSNDSDLSEIYLLSVEKNDSGGGGPGKGNLSTLRKLFDYSIKIGIGIGIKELIKVVFQKQIHQPK